MRQIRKYVSHRTLIVGGAVFALIVFTNAYAQNKLNLSNKAYADGQHLVSIYVDGEKRVVATSAGTVSAALDQLHVKVDSGDVVEPSADTEINQPIFNVNIYRALPATIFDDGKKVQVLTGYQSPRQIVTAAGLTAYPEDLVTMGRVDDFNLGGTVGREVVIKRAKPIQVVLAGQVYNFRTQKNTVGELLAEKGLQVKDSDIVSVDLSSPLSAGQRIVVNRLSQTITQVKEPIASTLSYEYDASQPVGYSRVKQDGKDGVKLVSYLVDLKDGAETDRKILDEKVIDAAVTKIIVKGSKVIVSSDLTSQKMDLMARAGISSGDYQFVDFIVNHEGGWDGVQKYNTAGSGAYGLCQALPGSKMATAGSDWATNPVTQLRWCNSYAARYGGWYGSYQHWAIYRSW